jgi:hypothetical protein
MRLGDPARGSVALRGSSTEAGTGAGVTPASVTSGSADVATFGVPAAPNALSRLDSGGAGDPAGEAFGPLPPASER